MEYVLSVSFFLEVCLYAQLLSCVGLSVTLQSAAHRAPLSMEFSRQEYWRELPFPPPGDLPNPGTKPRVPTLFTASTTWEAQHI